MRPAASLSADTTGDCPTYGHLEVSPAAAQPLLRPYKAELKTTAVNPVVTAPKDICELDERRPSAWAASSLGMFACVGGSVEETRDPQRGASGNENAAPGSRVNQVTPGNRAASAA